MSSSGAKLTQLRALFRNEAFVKGTAIQALLLPSTDAHQSEYLAGRDFRVKFLSGFSGSNAYVVVTNEKALLWTDGRYFVQAEKQLGEGWTLMKQGLPDSITPEDWLIDNLKDGDRVGFDPQLHQYESAKNMIKKLKQSSITAVPLAENPVDKFWESRPTGSSKRVTVLKPKEHGRDVADKVREVREKFAKKKAKAIVFAELDDIMWLLNIRGADIPYNPLAYSVCFVTENEVHLFIDAIKLDEEARRHLNESSVTVHAYEEARAFLEKWHEEHKTTKGYKVFIPTSTNYSLGSVFGKHDVVSAISPVQVMKSVKNATEIEGIRQCSIRDSAALIEFLHWLEKEVALGHHVDEHIAQAKIDGLRAQQPGFVDLSFDTISASGDHAALPHYKASDESGKRSIDADHVYLVDSGAHYRDGTTDVTRTVWNSASVPAEFVKHNTLVLMGHIDNATAVFPEMILGVRLDTLSRKSLWQHGLDFGHGTGHGVGHFLNVHEGPCGIGYRSSNPDGQIKAGQVITIEPGYYLPEKWGIRIENCYELITSSVAKGFLEFRSLTLVPIQKSIIDKNLLEPKHVTWLNAYHARVFETVAPYLEKSGKAERVGWLKEACAPL